MLGLEGSTPEGVEVERIDARLEGIRAAGRLHLLGTHPIAFREKEHLLMYRRESLPFHPNGMRFTAYDAAGQTLRARVYYSVGGGFVVDESAVGADRIVPDRTPLRFPFTTAAQLLEHCEANELSISEVMLENEKAWRSEAEIHDGLLHIWQVMQDCVRRGATNEGVMPGGLKVKRRAAGLYRKLSSSPEANLRDPLTVLDWISFYALAVNEENASGGRVVTAPTNGAAGIIPAVLHYYTRF